MGLVAARRLATRDAPTVLVDIDEDGLRAAVADVGAASGVVAESVVCDVSDPDSVAALAARVDELGGLRSLAHVAGISPTMADGRRVLTVDLVGTALLVQALEPLTTEGSAAVCWASIAGHSTPADPVIDAALDDPLAPDFLDRLDAAVGDALLEPGFGYGYAKRGVMRLVSRSAAAWGARGARICSVSPGIIDTPMGRQEFAEQPMMATMIEMTPIRRWGLPEEVCEVAAFLLSDGASFVTGCDVRVDGGVVSVMG